MDLSMTRHVLTRHCQWRYESQQKSRSGSGAYLIKLNFFLINMRNPHFFLFLCYNLVQYSREGWSRWFISRWVTLSLCAFETFVSHLPRHHYKLQIIKIKISTDYIFSSYWPRPWHSVIFVSALVMPCQRGCLLWGFPKFMTRVFWLTCFVRLRKWKFKLQNK